MQNTSFICILLGVVAFFYYDKYSKLSSKYKKLTKSYNQLKLEQHAKDVKLKEMSLYKEDVSKTFKILDNELGLINNHINNQRINDTINSVSLLTPNVLNNLLSNVNQETDREIQMEEMQNAIIEETSVSHLSSNDTVENVIGTINENIEQTKEECKSDKEEPFYNFYEHNEENYDKFLLD